MNSFTPFGGKDENINMSEFSLETAIKLFPDLKGEDDDVVYRFIEVREFAISVVKETGLPILVRVIRTKLSGKAFKVVQNRRISNWAG